MGWSQWGLIRIANKSYEDTLKIYFSKRDSNWGWTFKDTQNTETRHPQSYDEIERQDIGPNSSFAYGHTGKQNEWAGMEGTIELWTKNATGGREEHICEIFYSCPFSGSNKFEIRRPASGWHVTNWGADYNGNALGSVTVEVRRL